MYNIPVMMYFLKVACYIILIALLEQMIKSHIKLCMYLENTKSSCTEETKRYNVQSHNQKGRVADLGQIRAKKPRFFP